MMRSSFVGILVPLDVNMGEYLQINRDEEPLLNHLSFEQQLEHIVHPNYYEMATHRPVTLYCMGRGILFASAKDLHQHAKRGCPDVHTRRPSQFSGGYVWGCL